MSARPARSIGARRRRSSGAALLLVGALLWSLAVSAAVWLAVQHEMDELLDDTLRRRGRALIAPALAARPCARRRAAAERRRRRRRLRLAAGRRADGGARCCARRPEAPAAPLHATPTAGFPTTPSWRVFGLRAGQRRPHAVRGADAQRAPARPRSRSPSARPWRRWRWRCWRTCGCARRCAHELAPLQRLSQRLAGARPAGCPAPRWARPSAPSCSRCTARSTQLAAQLARRVAHERAFTAHAAHALRTPLAGIDAQLAVALREAPPALQPRLQRVRAAAGRLQRVVAALLALFRSGVEVQRQAARPASRCWRGCRSTGWR